uniref:Uncharacterized protein n=1 Tax=Candidatus Kentrum sp. TUN TaxID=2126343 RepID=A0A451ADA5_9GAMM|nr:MAG: hypothetical protein BECKTUN1418D_GA0071000_12392 [Candidatus Kentron sp. TUN]
MWLFFTVCTVLFGVYIHKMSVKCEGTMFDTRCREFDTGKDLKGGLVYRVSVQMDKDEKDKEKPWFDSCFEATPEGFGVKENPTSYAPKHCLLRGHVYTLPACDGESDPEKCKEEHMLKVREETKGKPVFILFGWLRRSPQHDWFRLLGQVGDGPIIPIDREKTIAPKRDGRLKLFVNDVDLIFLPWGRGFFYGNNHGQGTIKVE